MNVTQPIHLTELLRDPAYVIPEAAVPKRASLTVNCLITVKDQDDYRMVYHNFDPKNWNQWYPIFTFFHCDVATSTLNPKELIRWLENDSPIAPQYRSATMTEKLADTVKATLGATEVAIYSEPLITRDYWLKYSNSRNVWTLYCYEFFVADEVLPHSCLVEPGNPLIATVPLVAREYAGLAVVENTVEILDNPQNADRVRAHAISV